MTERLSSLLKWIWIFWGAFYFSISAGWAGPKTLTLRLSSEPETLDWNRAHTPIETHLLMNLMEGLISLDSDLKVIPSLAESWKVSSDRKIYTFHLRPGVKWSDGVLLKAQDFVYSWKRLLTPSTAAPYAYFLFDVVGAQAYHQGKLSDFKKVGIRALNDSTFQVELVRPVAHWIDIPSYWVTFPMRQDVVEKKDFIWDSPEKWVSIGPFVLSSHVLESKIILKANPHYYGNRGNIEQVVGLIVSDDSTALKLYETHKIDFMIDLSVTELGRLAQRSDLKIFPYLKTVYLGFVTGKFPVSQRHLRRAIASAIDKNKLTLLLHGGQKPAGSFVPPPLMGSSESIGLAYDLNLAKAELKLAAQDPSKIGPIRFMLPNVEKSLIVSQFIQEELKQKLGLEILLEPFDYKSLRSNLNLQIYPQYLMSWSADFPDPDNFLSVFTSDSGNNRTSWKNAAFDQMVVHARSLQKSSEREKLYQKLQKVLLEDEAVIVPLYYEPNPALIQPRVKNLELNPLNYLILRKVSLD